MDMLHHMISGLYYHRGQAESHYRLSKGMDFAPRSEMDHIQLSKLQRLVAFHTRQSAYYRELTSRDRKHFGGLEQLAEIQRLPIVTKDMIREIPRVDRIDAGSYTRNNSGGSTGEPVLIYSSREHDVWNKAAVMRTYDWLGYRVGERRMRLFAAPTKKGVRENSPGNRLKNYLANTRFIESSRLTPGLMDEIFDEIDRWQPKLITGYTSVLLQLAQHLQSRRRTLVHQGFVLQNAAEPLPDVYRDKIQEAFGVPMFDHYGTREIGYIAHDCPRRTGLHVHMQHLLVEIVDEAGNWVADGETGEILITQLENLAMPVIRYRIGDRAAWSQEACSCGRSLKSIKAVVGRSTDVIRLPNGTKIAGITFPHLFKDFPVHGFQVIQRKDYSLDVQIVFAKLQSAAMEADLIEPVRAALTREFSGLEVRIQVVDRIAKTNSEKLRPVISELEGITTTQREDRSVHKA